MDSGLKGVNILDDLSQASLDDIIIVRSHGESREFWNKAKEMNLDVVDATCPFVSKIHGLVSRASEDGYNIVIVGDENHPEVQGIKGWCKGEAMVIDSIESRENHRRQPLHRMPDYYKRRTSIFRRRCFHQKNKVFTRQKYHMQRYRETSERLPFSGR